MEEEIIPYPLYQPCSHLYLWRELEKQANELLGLPNKERETYSKPFYDNENNIYFIVFEEVVSLVTLSDCLTYEQITWKPFK